MFEKIIRPRFQDFIINPIASCLAKHLGVTPNFITLVSLVSGLLVIPFLVYDYKVVALLFLLFSGFMDVLDGSIARAFPEKSNLRGVVYDIVVDRVVEFSIILGLYFIDTSRATFIILMLGSVLLCVTSFLVVGIVSENNTKKGFFYSPGLMERFEAFLFFSLMILFPSLFNELAILFSVLVFFTFIFRIYEFRQQSLKMAN